MFTTKVHQTVDDKDNPDDVEKDGPFKAQRLSSLYLGDGYYFWDDHLRLAHWWGNVHCGGRYIICEGELKVEKKRFLDLVGSRQDMIELKRMIDDLGIQNKPLGSIIETLKTIARRPGRSGIFPFQVIRAFDRYRGGFDHFRTEFAENRKGHTYLDPIYIICMVEKNKLLLRSYRIVFPPQYIRDN